jgi:hypothetical protein
VKLLGFFASIVLLISAYAAYREATPFMAGNAMPRGSALYGISSYSQRMALDQCRESLLSVAASLQPQAERQASAQFCKTTAADILKRNPADAYAATILAAAGFVSGDVDLARRN